jgi:23S rRNA (pseudouridine1915-N3)-methyltransferase
MKITFLLVGKTTENYVFQGMEIFNGRLKHYTSFEIKTIPELKNTKNMTIQQQKELEGEKILQMIPPQAECVLLDENGKEYSSIGFAEFIQKRINAGTKQLIFIIGGPYGFSQEVYSRSNDKVSLSRMTFSHQLVRLIFTEQLYRAFTIIKGEPYHHE